MRDTSPGAVAVLREVAKLLDAPLSELTEGLGSASDAAERGMPWVDFCAVIDRMQERAGSADALRALGACAIAVPELGPALKVLRSVAGCQGLYWANFRWGGPSLFPLVETSFAVRRDGTFLGTISIPTHVLHNEGFFHLCAGVFQALPRVIGLDEAAVRTTVAPHVATYLIDPPRRASILSRLRWAMGALLSTSELVERLAEQNERLSEAHRIADQARDEAVVARLRAEESLAVAEARRAEAQAAVEARSAFVSTISHELRTPLNGILGMTQILLDSKLRDDQRDQLETIESSGGVLLRLINDLLDLAKIDAGRMALESTSVDLRGLVETVLTIATPRITQRDVEVLGFVDASVPASMLTDGLRLRQVLTNLLDNGLKFTEQGSVYIEVTQPEAHPDWLRFTVSDTGVGISAEHRTRIFEPFTQADSSTTRRFGGTGLGLSISHALATALGGRLTVASEYGTGSRFAFEIPIVDPVPLTLLPRRGRVRIDAAPSVRRAVISSLAGTGWEEDTDGNPTAVIVDMDSHSIPEVPQRLILLARRPFGRADVLPKPPRRAELVAALNGILPEHQPQTPVDALTVAVIDEDPVHASVVARCLTLLGHSLATAQSGADLVLTVCGDELADISEARERASEEWPDVRQLHLQKPVSLAALRQIVGTAAAREPGRSPSVS